MKSMKRRKKIICLSLAVVLIFSSTSAIFAGSAAASTATPATPASSDTNPEAISLSLEQAVRIMQTEGARAETAEINRKSDKALAEGYSEAVRSIVQVLDGIDKISQLENAGYPSSVIQQYTGYSSSIYASIDADEAGATVANKAIMKLRRDFAKGQIESNYLAEMNQIEYETVQIYYNVLLARDNFSIATDNVAAKKEILADTEAMKKMGMAANKDVLSVKADLAAAESERSAAETKYETAKMSFNFLLGYPVLQKVILTDQLTEKTMTAISVEDAVAGAIASRNEIKGANFAAGVHEILLKNMSVRYPENSSKYLNQQVAYLNAVKTAADAPKKIEIDIRSRYSDLEDKKEAMSKAAATLEYASEAYRLTKLSYEIGMSTLSDVTAMQVTSHKAALGAAAAVVDYDLAVYNFGYACKIGVSRLPL